MPYNDQLSDLAGTAAHTLAICCVRGSHRILVMHYIAVWFWLHVLAVCYVFVVHTGFLLCVIVLNVFVFIVALVRGCLCSLLNHCLSMSL